LSESLAVKFETQSRLGRVAVKAADHDGARLISPGGLYHGPLRTNESSWSWLGRWVISGFATLYLSLDRAPYLRCWPTSCWRLGLASRRCPSAAADPRERI